MERFMRKTGMNAYDIFVRESIEHKIGDVWFDGGYFVANGWTDLYSELEPINGQWTTIEAAALEVFNAYMYWLEEGSRQAEAECRAEWQMSYVCGGGRQEDASAAYMQLKDIT